MQIFDLKNFDETEREKIISVLKRNADLQRHDSIRLNELKAEIKRLKVRGALKPGLNGDSSCGRCRKKLGYIFDRGALCSRCLTKVCKECRHYFPDRRNIPGAIKVGTQSMQEKQDPSFTFEDDRLSVLSSVTSNIATTPLSEQKQHISFFPKETMNDGGKNIKVNQPAHHSKSQEDELLTTTNSPLNNIISGVQFSSRSNSVVTTPPKSVLPAEEGVKKSKRTPFRSRRATLAYLHTGIWQRLASNISVFNTKGIFSSDNTNYNNMSAASNNFFRGLTWDPSQQPNKRWVCTLCYKLMEYACKSGDWFYKQKHQKDLSLNSFHNGLAQTLNDFHSNPQTDNIQVYDGRIRPSIGNIPNPCGPLKSYNQQSTFFTLPLWTTCKFQPNYLLANTHNSNIPVTESLKNGNVGSIVRRPTLTPVDEMRSSPFSVVTTPINRENNDESKTGPHTAARQSIIQTVGKMFDRLNDETTTNIQTLPNNYPINAKLNDIMEENNRSNYDEQSVNSNTSTTKILDNSQNDILDMDNSSSMLWFNPDVSLTWFLHHMIPYPYYVPQHIVDLDENGQFCISNALKNHDYSANRMNFIDPNQNMMETAQTTNGKKVEKSSNQYDSYIVQESDKHPVIPLSRRLDRQSLLRSLLYARLYHNNSTSREGKTKRYTLYKMHKSNDDALKSVDESTENYFIQQDPNRLTSTATEANILSSPPTSLEKGGDTRPDTIFDTKHITNNVLKRMVIKRRFSLPEPLIPLNMDEISLTTETGVNANQTFVLPKFSSLKHNRKLEDITISETNNKNFSDQFTMLNSPLFKNNGHNTTSVNGLLTILPSSNQISDENYLEQYKQSLKHRRKFSDSIISIRNKLNLTIHNATTRIRQLIRNAETEAGTGSMKNIYGKYLLMPGKSIVSDAQTKRNEYQRLSQLPEGKSSSITSTDRSPGSFEPNTLSQQPNKSDPFSNGRERKRPIVNLLKTHLTTDSSSFASSTKINGTNGGSQDSQTSLTKQQRYALKKQGAIDDAHTINAISTVSHNHKNETVGNPSSQQRSGRSPASRDTNYPGLHQSFRQISTASSAKSSRSTDTDIELAFAAALGQKYSPRGQYYGNRFSSPRVSYISDDINASLMAHKRYSHPNEIPIEKMKSIHIVGDTLEGDKKYLSQPGQTHMLKGGEHGRSDGSVSIFSSMTKLFHPSTTTIPVTLESSRKKLDAKDIVADHESAKNENLLAQPSKYSSQRLLLQGESSNKIVLPNQGGLAVVTTNQMGIGKAKASTLDVPPSNYEAMANPNNKLMYGRTSHHSSSNTSNVDNYHSYLGYNPTLFQNKSFGGVTSEGDILPYARSNGLMGNNAHLNMYAPQSTTFTTGQILLSIHYKSSVMSLEIHILECKDLKLPSTLALPYYTRPKKTALPTHKTSMPAFAYPERSVSVTPPPFYNYNHTKTDNSSRQSSLKKKVFQNFVPSTQQTTQGSCLNQKSRKRRHTTSASPPSTPCLTLVANKDGAMSTNITSTPLQMLPFEGRYRSQTPDVIPTISVDGTTFISSSSESGGSTTLQTHHGGKKRPSIIIGKPCSNNSPLLLNKSHKSSSTSSFFSHFLPSGGHTGRVGKLPSPLLSTRKQPKMGASAKTIFPTIQSIDITDEYVELAPNECILTTVAQNKNIPDSNKLTVGDEGSAASHETKKTKLKSKGSSSFTSSSLTSSTQKHDSPQTTYRQHHGAFHVPNPYVKMYLLPVRSRLAKRKTKTKFKTAHPIFNEMLEYKPIYSEELRTYSLQISVLNREMFGKNSTIGDVIIPLKDYNFGDVLPRWYTLKSPPYHF